MEVQQPLDYVEDCDQLEELKAAITVSEYSDPTDVKILDIQEDSYLVID